METAFYITTLAGLATAIGAALALPGRPKNNRFLSRALAFSAGVMLCVSFLELLPEALTGIQTGLALNLSDTGLGPAPTVHAFVWTAAAFLLGALFVAIIEAWIPAGPTVDPDRQRPSGSSQNTQKIRNARLNKAGLLIAVSLAVHNFPEGVAVFVSNLDADGTDGSSAGLALAAAIAIHNIPEGVAVAIPVLYATRSRWYAFVVATLSGLTEPLGALLAYAVLAPFMSPLVLGLVFAAVAGMMVYISLDTLLPAALASNTAGNGNGSAGDSLVSLAMGAVVMGAGLFAI